MYGNLSYFEHIASQSGHAQNSSTGAARRLAVGQFWLLRFTSVWRSLWKRFTARNMHLADLEEVVLQQNIVRRRSAGIQSVPLNEIVGSEGRSRDFDADFRPLVSHIRDRWVGIAVARMRSIPLPPVNLVRVNDRYFVRDGNHRISVARYMGQTEIDAEVTVWETA